MVKQLDQILVVDIESTCWVNKPPIGQISEIIEVGICALDVASGKRLTKESILVKPTRSIVSNFCTELTTLTQTQVDLGISFAEACQILKKKYLSKNRLWASYGDYDRRQFERQCATWGVGYPFGPGHLNVKTLLGVMYHLPYEVGLVEGLQYLNLPLEGTHHRGDDDAWNIAALLRVLLNITNINEVNKP